MDEPVRRTAHLFSINPDMHDICTSTETNKVSAIRMTAAPGQPNNWVFYQAETFYNYIACGFPEQHLEE